MYETAAELSLGIISAEKIIGDLKFSKVSYEIDSNTTDRHQQDVIFHQDHVSLQEAHQTTQKIAEMGWEVLTHPLCSPDLAQSDFHLFGPLKESLRKMQLNLNTMMHYSSMS